MLTGHLLNGIDILTITVVSTTNGKKSSICCLFIFASSVRLVRLIETL